MVHLARREVWREKRGKTMSRTEEEQGGTGL